MLSPGGSDYITCTQIWKEREKKLSRKFKFGRTTWQACSINLETWELSQHSLVDKGKPRKTCVEVAGRTTFRILTSSQQSGIWSAVRHLKSHIISTVDITDFSCSYCTLNWNFESNNIDFISCRTRFHLPKTNRSFVISSVRNLMTIFAWPPSSHYTIYKIISLTLGLFPYVISER